MFSFFVDLTELGREFKNWATGLKASDYPGVDVRDLVSFRLWVSQSPTSRAGQLALEIAELCAMPGFDKTWFRSILRHPEPGSPPSQMLVFFGLAAYKRWDSLHVLRILNWMKDPQAADNQNFGWQIFLRLVEAGFIQIPGEFLLDSNNRRNKIIEGMVRKAYKQDFPLLVSLTREIMWLKDNPIKQPPAETPENEMRGTSWMLAPA